MKQQCDCLNGITRLRAVWRPNKPTNIPFLSFLHVILPIVLNFAARPLWHCITSHSLMHMIMYMRSQWVLRMRSNADKPVIVPTGFAWYTATCTRCVTTSTTSCFKPMGSANEMQRRYAVIVSMGIWVYALQVCICNHFLNHHEHRAKSRCLPLPGNASAWPRQVSKQTFPSEVSQSLQEWA